MKLFQQNYVKNLPDRYNKEKTSNNYKIMQLIGYDDVNFQKLLEEISDSLNLDSARGYTLDLYGDMVGQNRGKANDAQYLLMIKGKNARNHCTGTNSSIVDCLCMMLNCEPSEILLEDSENPAKAVLTKVPLGNIILSDFTPNQFTQLVKTLLPAGVELETSLYEGTFEFSDSEDEMSDTKGFCQNEGDTYGGYFGVLSDDKNETILPI